MIDPEKPHEYVHKLETIISSTYQHMMTNIFEMRERENNKKENSVISFKINDLVWRDTHVLFDAAKGITASLADKREGPCVITDYYYFLNRGISTGPSSIKNSTRNFNFHQELGSEAAGRGRAHFITFERVRTSRIGSAVSGGPRTGRKSAFSIEISKTSFCEFLAFRSYLWGASDVLDPGAHNGSRGWFDRLNHTPISCLNAPRINGGANHCLESITFKDAILEVKRVVREFFHTFLDFLCDETISTNPGKYQIAMSKDKYTSAANRIELLDKNNYDSWKLNIKLLLEEFDLYCYTDNTGSATPLAAGAKDEEVKKFNKRKLAPYRSRRHRRAADKHPTTKEVWDHLRSVFEPSSRARKALLREKFHSLRIEPSEAMDDFIERVDTAAKDLESVAVKIADDEKAFMLLSSTDVGCVEQMKQSQRKQPKHTKRRYTSLNHCQSQSPMSKVNAQIHMLGGCVTYFMRLGTLRGTVRIQKRKEDYRSQPEDIVSDR
uniref:DUF4219 domain-containing protein n=1 Tax=Strigamia maritima TaxID=126957 RepID=T1IRY0_STRMM